MGLNCASSDGAYAFSTLSEKASESRCKPSFFVPCLFCHGRLSLSSLSLASFSQVSLGPLLKASAQGLELGRAQVVAEAGSASIAPLA